MPTLRLKKWRVLEMRATVRRVRNLWPFFTVAVLGSSLTRPALSQSLAACDGPRIALAVPAAQREQWLTLYTHLSEHLRALSDLDRCAELTLLSDGKKTRLVVRASDGRTASRPVENEAQALRAAEALLMLPPKPSAPSAAPSAPRAVSPLEEPPFPAPSVPTRSSTRLELGAGASARLGGLPSFIAGGLVGFAEVVVDRWLLGVDARWDITTGLLAEPTLMDYYLMSSAVGVRLGRRFEPEGATLDLLLGPNLVLEAQDADDGNLDIGGRATDVRLAFGARLSGPRSCQWCAFASSDFELSPARLGRRHFAQPSLPALPAFTFGVALGILWRGK